MTNGQGTRHLSTLTGDPDEGVTAKQFALLAKVDIRTIHRWHKSGAIPAGTKIGPRLVRWPRSAVAAVLAGN